MVLNLLNLFDAEKEWPLLMASILKGLNGFPFGLMGRKHVIRIPSIVIVGEEVLDSILEVADSLSIDSVLIVTGSFTQKIAGKFIYSMLTRRGVKVKMLLVSKPSLSEVRQGIELYSKFKYDAVIGVGGGKNLDVGKVIAKETRALFISVPTTASHDGIASPFASLLERKGRYSLQTIPPIAVIADIEIISKAPRRFFCAGIGDVISNINAVQDWYLAHKVKNEYYGEYAANLALMSAEHLMKNEHILADGNKEAIRTLVEALISSGIAMGIAGSSRPGSGAEHLFSHALDRIARKPALHGEQCGVGTILMLYYRGDDRWMKVREFLRNIGAPTSAHELGISDDEVIRALMIAHKIRPERYTILGENGLSFEDAYKIAIETEVIK